MRVAPAHRRRLQERARQKPTMEDHSSPIKTPKQLVIVVLIAFAVPIAIAALLSQLVTSGEQGMTDNSDHVLARIQPVGTVVLAEATGPKGMLDRRPGVRPGLQDVPRRGARGRAQDRRQGRMGQDHRARRKDDVRARDQRLQGDAAARRQQRSHGRRGQARRGVHGEQGRRQLDVAAGRGHGSGEACCRCRPLRPHPRPLRPRRRRPLP